MPRPPHIPGDIYRWGSQLTILILLAWALSLAWMIWLVVVAWRMQNSEARRLAGEGVGRPAATGLNPQWNGRGR